MKMPKTIKKINTGFTLIELLVAMTVMAVLIAVGLLSYQGSKKAARDGKRKADIEQIRSALEIYRSDCKTYPTSNLPWGLPLTGFGTCAGTYMSVVPQDLGACQYYYSGALNTYRLCTSLENSSAAAIPACGSNCGGASCPCNYSITNP